MMKRRDFILRFAGAAVAAPFALGAIAACGDDGGGDGGGDPVDAATGGPDGNGTADARRPDAMPAAVSDCDANDPTVTIGSNHSHAMTVTKAEVTAGVEKAYEIRGSSNHPHTVTLTAAHFTMLQNGMTVMVNSTVGHVHQITVNCV